MKMDDRYARDIMIALADHPDAYPGRAPDFPPADICPPRPTVDNQYAEWIKLPAVQKYCEHVRLMTEAGWIESQQDIPDAIPLRLTYKGHKSLRPPSISEIREWREQGR